MQKWVKKFRSTGSYEPDRIVLVNENQLKGFDPQALTSLTTRFGLNAAIRKFRSTGSYEPDLFRDLMHLQEMIVSIHRLLRA